MTYRKTSCCIRFNQVRDLCLLFAITPVRLYPPATEKHCYVPVFQIERKPTEKMGEPSSELAAKLNHM